MSKNFDCGRARRELMRSAERVSVGAARHLESCSACGDFAARLAAARRGLADHRAAVEPDAGFAARVTAALPPDSAADGMSWAVRWAALRLLPAAVALALVLGAWSWLATSSPARLGGAPSDDVLSWVLDNGSGS